MEKVAWQSLREVLERIKPYTSKECNGGVNAGTYY